MSCLPGDRMLQLSSHIVLAASLGKCGHQAAMALAPGREHSLSACALGWLAGMAGRHRVVPGAGLLPHCCLHNRNHGGRPC